MSRNAQLLLIVFVNSIYLLVNSNPTLFGQETLIKFIISNTKVQECTPILVLAKDEARPDYINNIFFQSPQQIHVQFQKLDSGRSLKPQVYSKFQHSKACSIVLYFIQHSSVNLNFLKSFQDNFIRKIPGGIFGSFHILFTPAGLEKELQLSMPEILLQMHNLLFVSVSKAEAFGFDLSTLDVFDKSKLSSIGTFVWSETSGTKRISTISPCVFQERWKDFKGRPFILATTPDTTQSQMDDFLRTKQFNTYAIVGTYEVLRYINATPFINTVKTGIYGKKTKNGTWIGLIGEVLAGRAHATTAVQILQDRAEVIEYTKTYIYDGVVFLTALKKKAGPSGNVEFLAQPLSPIVWLCLLLTFLTTYATLIIRSCKDPSNTRKLYVDLLLILNIMLRPVMDQPGDTPSLGRRLRNDLTRLIFALWLMALIVLSCAYKSKLISALLTPTFENPPQTFAELAESNYGIGAVLFNESFVGESFRALNNNIGKEVSKRTKAYKVMDPACYSMTQTHKEVCLGVRAFIEPIVNIYLTDENGQSVFRFSKDSLFPIMASMTFPKKFPHFSELIGVIILRTESQGLIQHWIRQGSVMNSIKGRRLAKMSKKTKTITNELSSHSSSGDQEVQHYISILVVGLGISLGILILEKIFSIVKQNIGK